MPGSFFRIGTLLNLAFNPFEGRFKTVLTLLQSTKVVLQVEVAFAKLAAKLMVERFCLAWCSSSLRPCRGTLPIGAPESLGEIQIFAKSELSS